MSGSGGSLIGRDAPVRIALLGNLANNFYREALALCDVEHLEVLCFVEAVDTGPNTDQPTSDPQGQLRSETEVTCFFKPMLGVRWYLLLLPLFILKRLKNFDRIAYEELKAMDLRVFSSSYIMWAAKFRGINVIWPTGSDLTVFPSLVFEEYWRLRGTGRPSLRARLLWKLMRYYYRRGYRKASAVTLKQHPPYVGALEDLGVTKERIAEGIPLAVDTEAFQKVSERSSLIPACVRDEDFVVFMPSRVMMSDSTTHRKTGQWKASEVGIQGFHLFLRSLEENQRERTWLLVPDRTLSDELHRAKALIDSLGMETHVIWLRGETDQGLTRQEMVPIYSRACATFDDFGVGWYGSVVVEAAACESPIVTYVTDEVLATAGNPPLMIAQTPEEVALHLQRLHNDAKAAEQIGRDSREWVREFHSEHAVELAYKRLLDHVGLSP